MPVAPPSHRSVVAAVRDSIELVEYGVVRAHPDVRRSAIAAAGLVPGVEGDSVGHRAVVFGIGLEVEPRIGISSQQSSIAVRYGSQCIPIRAVVGRVEPSAVGGVGPGDSDAEQRTGVGIGNIIDLAGGRREIDQV